VSCLALRHKSTFELLCNFGVQSMKVLLTTCGAWYLPNTAKAFAVRDALAGLWVSEKNRAEIPSHLYRRCWPFHLALKPFYHLAPQILEEKAFYAFFPLWRWWLQAQKVPQADVVHAVAGYATEAFDIADRIGALKVIECPNSNPLTYYGIWQRECDLWCPGEKVPIPRSMFARMNRELERADLVVVLSQFCKDSMILSGIPEEKIMVNVLGVDTTIFKKRPAVPERPRFVSVGTICVRKGFQYLFRAFEIVKKAMPDAELICVGGYKTDFRMERPKWEGSFTHHPNLTHAELSELLQSCTAFVFPSQEEGFARVQMEALACGLPVIGTHEAGTTTVLKHGIEGLIVPGRDPKKIAEAMIRLGTDRELNEKMGDAAYSIASGNTWQDYADRFLVEYARRLGK